MISFSNYFFGIESILTDAGVSEIIATDFMNHNARFMSTVLHVYVRTCECVGVCGVGVCANAWLVIIFSFKGQFNLIFFFFHLIFICRIVIIIFLDIINIHISCVYLLYQRRVTSN